jgi:aldehyde dehydrogenase
VRAYNQAIHRETGIENVVCIIEQPTLDSFSAMCQHEAVRLLCVTGGPGVVAAAMKTGKRAICAGPGNPPVYVDDTACLKRAAKGIIAGAAYDNNLLCIGEKEVFASKYRGQVDAEMERNGAVRLSSSQLDALTKSAFTFSRRGGGCARLGEPISSVKPRRAGPSRGKSNPAPNSCSPKPTPAPFVVEGR